MARLGAAHSPLARSTGELFARFHLPLEAVAPGAPIPGSYWGAPEAGLKHGKLCVRDDTPVHSALHEGCHFACMTPARRRALDTDAGGDDLEECAVCYLSVVLSDHVAGFGRKRMLRDMDAWGYSFRLGSAAAWFRDDADDARDWLEREGLLERQPDGRPVPTFRRRGDASRD